LAKEGMRSAELLETLQPLGGLAARLRHAGPGRLSLEGEPGQ
jgi:hypothetical protein